MSFCFRQPDSSNSNKYNNIHKHNSTDKIDHNTDISNRNPQNTPKENLVYIQSIIEGRSSSTTSSPSSFDSTSSTSSLSSMAPSIQLLPKVSEYPNSPNPITKKHVAKGCPCPADKDVCDLPEHYVSVTVPWQTPRGVGSEDEVAIPAAEPRKGPKKHADWSETEAARPAWDESKSWQFTQTRQPGWKLGDGANDGGACLKAGKHVEIDPYETDRPTMSNYKLMISGTGPRPSILLGTRSKDGGSTNLAPFSYVQMINFDPPLFIIGFATGFDRPRDSLVNLAETGECTVNFISEHILEAASACSMNVPHGISEWALSGLTPAASTSISPGCSRVKESIFSAECVLVSTQEFSSKANPMKKTGVLAIVEATRFWVREDALTGGEEGARALIDPEVYRPVGRMGDITFSRTTEGVQIPKIQDPDGEIRKLQREHLVCRKAPGQC